MSSSRGRLSPEALFRTGQIVSLAFIMSVVFYGALVFLGGTYLPFQAPAPDLVILKYLFCAIGLLLVPVSLVFRNNLLNLQRITARAARMGARAKQVRESADPAALAAAQLFMAGHVVPLALVEAIAILGLVLYLITGDKELAAVLIAASLVAMIPHFPRRTVFNDVLARLELMKMSGTAR